jgi:protein pelota
MKIIFEDLRKGVIKIKVENLDDLWHLSGVIEKKDFVEGETYRKIKVGGTDEASDASKKRVFLKILVEKVEFHEYSSVLRVSGVITDGPEDIPRGQYHTFNLEEGTIIKIFKERFLNYQYEKLKEASQSEHHKILICIFDREEAIIAKLKRYSYEILTQLKGQIQKKAIDQQEKNFYQEIIKVIEEYDKRENYTNIIAASPSFFKEYLLKEIKNEALKKKIVQATCSQVSESAIGEVLKREELKTVLANERASKELKLVEELLLKISKDNLGVYGFRHVKEAVNSGAVSELLVTDKLIHKRREEKTFAYLEDLMRTVESSRGEVHLISSENEGGKKLDGLGGIAGILRYRLEY